MPPEGTRGPWLGVLALTVALGLLGGGLVTVATWALSTTELGGPGWSLRGNGALIVEFAGGPARSPAAGCGWSAARFGPALSAVLLALAIELGVGIVRAPPKLGCSSQ